MGGGGKWCVPFLRAFCFSSLRWAAAGFRARSLSLAMVFIVCLWRSGVVVYT